MPWPVVVAGAVGEALEPEPLALQLAPGRCAWSASPGRRSVARQWERGGAGPGMMPGHHGRRAELEGR